MMVITRRALLALCGTLLLSIPLAGQTPTADELVAKYLTARGGMDKIKSVNTARISGTLSAQGMDMPFTMTTKRPNRMRQEITMQGASMIQAFDGTTVWMVNPMMGSPEPRALEGPQADLIKNQAVFDGPLVGYKERGDTLEVVGPADVDGAKGWKVKLTRQNGQSMQIVLDADTGLERQYIATLEQNGLQQEVQTFMSDYQATDGLQVARTMRTMMNGQQVVGLKFDTVEFNVPVEDAFFSMPAK